MNCLEYTSPKNENVNSEGNSKNRKGRNAAVQARLKLEMFYGGRTRTREKNHPPHPCQGAAGKSRTVCAAAGMYMRQPA